MLQLRIWVLPAFLAMFTLGAVDGAERLKALIVDGQNNHNWRKTTPVLRDALEASGRFTVVVATSPLKGEDLSSFRPAFKDYDVVVSNYNGRTWAEATRKDLEKYMEGGGGLVVVHAADNSFADWPEFNRMIGLGGWRGRDEKSGPYLRLRDGRFVRDHTPGRGGGHGRQHPFLLVARQTDHPILRGLPSQWMHAKDELYDRLRGPAEKLTVLATAYSPPEQGGTGEHEPTLMTIEYGAGRTFHSTLGHSPEAMTCAGFQVTLCRGAEWAATGKVTLTDVPADFPTATAVKTRPLPGDSGWTPLLRGNGLDGWEQHNGTATYKVEDGVVVGTTAEGSPNSFLCTKKHYGNFELKFEVKVDSALNSGVQIRSASWPDYGDGRVHGYQVEIATNGTAGYVYDEARRGWLSLDRSDEKARAAFKDGEWNAYRVSAVRGLLKTWVNGVPVAYVLDDMTRSGFIGLQVHSVGRGTGPYQVRWRNLYIKDLDKDN